MGVSKPVEGYPSRTAAIRAMRARGMETAEIAERLGVPCRHINGISSGVRIVLPHDALAALAPHAAARGCSASELARRILKVTIKDGLIDAVLDDARPEKAAA